VRIGQKTLTNKQRCTQDDRQILRGTKIFLLKNSKIKKSVLYFWHLRNLPFKVGVNAFY